MLRDSGTIRSSYDLCVVGAGPAGIILALEFSRKRPGSKILLIEFGDGKSRRNRLDESIENLNEKNHFGPYDCTNKGLGGSTATWGGRCVMYDPIDFVPHGLITEKECTWDTSFYDDTLRFVPIACDYFQCGDENFDLATQRNPLPAIADKFIEGEITSTKLEKWSLPTRFGPEYKRTLHASPEIDLMTGYQASGFEVASDGRITQLIAVASSGTQTLRIKAEHFVLTCGGQEATRLLLNNPEIFKTLEETPQSLGKFYQGHISGKISNILFYGNPDATEYGYSILKDKALTRRRFQFSSTFIQKEGLLNTAFWLDNLPVYDARHRNGVLSLIYLIMVTPGFRNRLLHAAMARTLTNDQVSDLPSHFLNVLYSLPSTLIKTTEIAFRRYIPRRKLPGLHLKSPRNLYALHFHAEQVPRTESRMYLSDNGEKLVIDYAYSEEEIACCIKAHHLLDEYLKKLNCGKLEFYHNDDRALAETIINHSKDGLHQIGTTRIAKNASQGVVDYDLKVFGTKNLYVCTSSVFPTSGQANPTFYLGVCAARLAEHLVHLTGSPT
jgi:hypothetical protein